VEARAKSFDRHVLGDQIGIDEISRELLAGCSEVVKHEGESLAGGGRRHIGGHGDVCHDQCAASGPSFGTIAQRL
jgi:hypothetical protein